MPTRSEDVDHADLEARIVAQAPREPTDEDVSRVREKVSKASFRRASVFRYAVALVAVALLAGVLVLWVSGRGWQQQSSAFAYDMAAGVIAPADGVLHVVLSHYYSNTEAGATVEVGTGTLADTAEHWVDLDTERSRVEIQSDPEAVVYVVVSPPRVLSVSKSPLDPGPHVSETLWGEGGTDSPLDPIQWLRPDWARSFAEAMDDRVCDVEETVTPDGVEAWSVTWWEDTEMGVLTNRALFRRNDYRPLSIFRRIEYAPSEDGLVPESEEHRTDVDEWEVYAPNEVPEGTFEARADLTDPTATYDIWMTADDPRLRTCCPYAVWWLGAESQDRPLIMANWVSRAPGLNRIAQKGFMSVRYGGDPVSYAEPVEDQIVVTTYATTSTDAIDEYWLGNSFGTITQGEAEGREYRMCAGTLPGYHYERAKLLIVIGKVTVEIDAPGSDAALAALRDLEPL